MLFKKLLFPYCDRAPARKFRMRISFTLLFPLLAWFTNEIARGYGALYAVWWVLLVIIVPDKTNDLYEHNRKGQAKVARHMFKHRDVIDVKVDYPAHWNWAVRMVFVNTTIPILINTPLILYVIIVGYSYLTSGQDMAQVGVGVIAVLLFSAIVSSFCDWLANVTMLGSDETNDMYESPHEYAENISVRKEEIRRQKAVEDARRLIEEEERRNRRHSRSYDPQIPYENDRSLEDRNYRQNSQFQYNDDLEDNQDPKYQYRFDPRHKSKNRNGFNDDYDDYSNQLYRKQPPRVESNDDWE